MRASTLLSTAYMAVLASAVKHELFKDCNQAGFCVRNRFYANQISAAKAESPYFIDSTSVTQSEKAIEAAVKKRLPNGAEISFELLILMLPGDNVRFKVDEKRNISSSGPLNVKRYDGTAAAAFGQDPEEKTLHFPSKLTKNAQKMSFEYGLNNNLRLELTYNPVKLTIYKNDEPLIVLNDKQFLNIEHYRTQKENDLNLISELESDFDMFQDSWSDSSADTIPLGPEAVAVDVSFVNFKHAYGIPEHADSMSLKSTTSQNSPYRLYNVDIFEYETDSRMPMYGSIPLLVGIKPEASVGVFWMNSADTFVDIEKGSSINAHWISENGVLDLVLMVGDSPGEITSKFGLLTGNAALPPKFALGYHQCRWNYVSETDLLDVHSKMDAHAIPYDTIWLDVEYADKKKYFTWDTVQFPNYIDMMKKLDETGRNLVVIVDPHLKTSYKISDYVDEHNLAMRDPKNKSYKGHCWPGESIWIDSLNTGAQQYWDSLFRKSSECFIGSQDNVHLWNDMNEPSVFNGPESTAPKDNLHFGGWEHRSVHNLWGKSFHELTYHSLVKRSSESNRQRPFVLTRAYFAGSQRTAAMWTGDNMSKWEYLKISIPMVLTSNLVNMPFSGADVGGFFGDPTEELLARWYQTGIFYPFFRAHAHIDSRRREPYLLSEPYLSVVRDAVRLRYALLPTLYTLFHESSITGAPIWRPMVFDNTQDLKTYEIDDQFFLGNSGLLVKPVTEENASQVSVYIPDDKEIYYDYTNGKLNGKSIAKTGYFERNVKLQDIPMFFKGGSIIARQDRIRRSSKLMANDPYTLVVALSKLLHANGSLYLDDGESFAYQKGESVLVSYDVTSGKKLTSSVSKDSLSFVNQFSSVKVEKIIVAGIQDEVSAVIIRSEGEKREAKFSQGQGILEIKRPNVSVASDWEITLVTKTSHDEL